MFAKVLIFCAAVAAASATALLGSGLYASGLYKSGIVAPGLLNTAVVAPGLYKGSPYIAAPIAAAVPTTYTTKTVVSAPAVVAAPIAYAHSPVVAAPAAITTHKTVIGATSLLTGAPLVYNSGYFAGGHIAGGYLNAAPYALNHGIVSPIGLKGGLLAGPGLVKTILK